MDLLDAKFCFESCRGRERGVDALVCKGYETMWPRACGKGWDGTSPKCQTDERVEVFMPKVPAEGQVVIKVEGEEGSGGEEEEKEGGGRGEGERRRDVEDVRGWCVCVQDEDESASEAAQGRHS